MWGGVEPAGGWSAELEGRGSRESASKAAESEVEGLERLESAQRERQRRVRAARGREVCEAERRI